MLTMSAHSLGSEMVSVLQPLVGDHIINFMETGGTIVASSDPARVGTFHSGAAEAAASRRVVRIRPGDLPADSNGREGINLPVVKNGEVLGVIGVHGRPEDLEQFVRLLDACVELYLEQTLTSNHRQLRRELRLDLMRRIIGDVHADVRDIDSAAREAGVEPRLPVRVIALMPVVNGEGRRHWFEQLTRLQNVLASKKRLDERCDLAEVMNDAVMVCRHVEPGADAVAHAHETHALLCRELRQPVSLGVGSECADWRRAAKAGREAMALAKMAAGGCLCIDSARAKVNWLMQGCLEGAEEYVRSLEDTLARGFGAGHMARIMRTVRAYCEADCSGGKAAADLGIHKNTMNYRMNKIMSLLGLEDENAFVKEFFLRLLLLHHRPHK